MTTEQISVEVTQATGVRKVRKELTTVDLPHYRVTINRRLVGISSMTKNKPLLIVAEVLEREEADLISALQTKREDTQPIDLLRPPTATK